MPDFLAQQIQDLLVVQSRGIRHPLPLDPELSRGQFALGEQVADADGEFAARIPLSPGPETFPFQNLPLALVTDFHLVFLLRWRGDSRTIFINFLNFSQNS